MPRLKTHEEFVEDLSRSNPDVLVLGKYINAKTKIKVRCLICGNEWNPTPNSLLSGHGCPECKKVKLSKPRGIWKKTQDAFIEEMRITNPDISVLGRYVTSSRKLLVKCHRCGHEWMATPNSLLSGHGCPECKKATIGKANRVPEAAFLEEFSMMGGNIELLGEYEGLMTPLHVRCGRCGYEWNALPHDLLMGRGCPECWKGSTSFMEQFIRFSISKRLDESAVLSRDRSEIGQELDIFVPSYNPPFAIEIGSWIYHSETIEKDLKKRNLCEEKGIRLFTIYDSYKEENPPFESDCWIFPIDLGSEQGHWTLRKLANSINESLGIESLEEDDFKEIEEKAREASLRVTTEQFKERLESINPDIEVIGEYLHSMLGIKCRCRRCGYEWSPTPASLIQGQGCRKCADKRNGLRQRLTHEQFLARMDSIHPELIVIGSYETSQTPIKTRCKNCGYEWSPKPNHLLMGEGCPKCSGNLVTPEDYERFIFDKNPRIELLERYKRSKSRIKCRCKDCGYEWSPMAGYLKRRPICPECKNHSIGE